MWRSGACFPTGVAVYRALRKRNVCNHPVTGFVLEQSGLQRLFGRCFNTCAESAPRKLVGTVDLDGKRTG